MAPEGSLPHSQVPTNCSYPEPARVSPYPHIPLHLNIILPSTPGSPKWSLSLRFPHQNSVYASPLPHTCYITRPCHSSRFYHPNTFGWAVQVIKLLSLCNCVAGVVFNTKLLHSVLIDLLLLRNVSVSVLGHLQGDHNFARFICQRIWRKFLRMWLNHN